MNAPAILPSMQRLGDLLLQEGHLTEEQLILALRRQDETGEALGTALLKLGFMEEEHLLHLRAQHLGLPSVRLSRHLPYRDLPNQFSPEAARTHEAIVFAANPETQTLSIARSSPEDRMNSSRLSQLIPSDWRRQDFLCSDDDLAMAISCLSPANRQIRTLLNPTPTPGLTLPQHTEAFSIRLVDALIQEALEKGASDLHFEPEAAHLRIRYRIDGCLHVAHHLDKSHWPALCIRLKILAGMNIAETRAPQDGRFSQAQGAKTLDFRAASLPTLHGENIVLRILRPQEGLLRLHELRLSETHRTLLTRLLARPEGILLISGPTGSGKTTTLYALLHRLNQPEQNIMTLEDPIELVLPGLRQSAISESGKLSFGQGVRALMRQDPDIILIGEIRDAETAQMAFRAALTGHQVFATLHANHALGSLTRVHELGIPAAHCAQNLTGILAQRLIRTLCPHCKVPQAPNPDIRALLQRHGQPDDALYEAAGCPQCAGLGYRGRQALMEILPMTEELAEGIETGKSSRQLRQIACESGFLSLQHHGLATLAAGDTSLKELGRAIDLGSLYA